MPWSTSLPLTSLPLYSGFRLSPRCKGRDLSKQAGPCLAASLFLLMAVAELLKAGQAVFSELKNLCVWNKTNGGMGTLYRSKHELVFAFKGLLSYGTSKLQPSRSPHHHSPAFVEGAASTIDRGRKGFTVMVF
jgi:hypothetical protein